MSMFGLRWRVNSGPMKSISGGFVLHPSPSQAPEMSFVDPLFILHRGPNMPIFWRVFAGSAGRPEPPGPAWGEVGENAKKKGGWVTLCFEWGTTQGSQWLYIVVVSFLCKKKLFPQLSSFFDHFPLIFHAIYDIVNPDLMEFLQKWPKSCHLRRKPRMATWGLPDTSPPYMKKKSLKSQWKFKISKFRFFSKIFRNFKILNFHWLFQRFFFRPKIEMFWSQNVFDEKVFGFFSTKKKSPQKIWVTYSDPKFSQDSKNRT